MMKAKDIKFDGNRRGPRQYGVYHPAEAGPCVTGFDPETGTVEKAGIESKREYIAWFENNAPPMSKRLWKIREQLTIAQKSVFDAIIELPEDHQWLQMKPLPSVVKDHFYSIMLTIKSMDELDYIREAA